MFKWFLFEPKSEENEEKCLGCVCALGSCGEAKELFSFVCGVSEFWLDRRSFLRVSGFTPSNEGLGGSSAFLISV